MTLHAVTNMPQQLGSRQLTLGVTLNTQQQLSNFSFAGAPALSEAVDQLLKTDHWDSLYVFGGPSVGKSHLLQGCVLQAQEMDQEAIFISCSELLKIPAHQASDCLFGLETNTLICVDDLHLLVAHDQWAQAWFHLYNNLTQQGSRLVLSATSNPRTIDCALNDLRSRLQMAGVFALHSLDEQASGQLLQAKAKQKGLQLNDEQVAYIFSRSPRGLTHLLAVLDALDAASWHEKRRITIPFIKQVMAW